PLSLSFFSIHFFFSFPALLFFFFLFSLTNIFLCLLFAFSYLFASFPLFSSLFSLSYRKLLPFFPLFIFLSLLFLFFFSLFLSYLYALFPLFSSLFSLS